MLHLGRKSNTHESFTHTATLTLGKGGNDFAGKKCILAKIFLPRLSEIFIKLKILKCKKQEFLRITDSDGAIKMEKLFLHAMIA